MNRCVIPARKVLTENPALFVWFANDARVSIYITQNDNFIFKAEQVYHKSQCSLGTLQHTFNFFFFFAIHAHSVQWLVSKYKSA